MSGAGKFYKINPQLMEIMDGPILFPWEQLCGNPHDAAIDLMFRHPNNVEWNILTYQNEEVLQILKRNDAISRNYVRKSTENIIAYLSERSMIEDVFIDYSAINSDAIMTFLEEYPLLIEPELSANKHPKAIALLRKNPELIDWELLSGNSSAGAFTLLMENLENLDCNAFSGNSNDQALDLLERYPGMIGWDMLCSNTNSRAIKLLEEKKKKEPLFRFSKWMSSNTNPFALDLLAKYPNEIDACELASNPTNEAMELLSKYPQHIEHGWFQLVNNPNPRALKMVLQYYTEMPLFSFVPILHNPHIFEYDYSAIREAKHDMHMDFAKYLFHPKNISKFADYQFSDYGNDISF